MINIQVGIPSYSGKLFPAAFETVKNLSAYEGEVSFNVFIIPQCYSASEGRNIGVSLGKRTKKQSHSFDYFLSMDADNSFEVRDVLMLIDRDKDIISAAYPMRSAAKGSTTDRFVAAHWREGQAGVAHIDNYLPIINTKGLIKVDTVGLGCCLIKRKVFETMVYPYFRNNVVDEIYNGETLSGLAADDVSFAVNVAKFGFEIYLDADVVVLHHAGNEDR